MEMLPNRLCLWPIYDSLQISHCRLADFRQRAEMAEQFLRGFQANAFNLGQLGRKRPAAAALAMEGDRETMTLVANLLNHAQNRRPAVQNNRLIFPAGNVDDLFLFRDARQGLI